MDTSEVQAVVLFSGGWDSTLCLIEALDRYERVVPAFIDYGQPYLAEEQAATDAIAVRFGIIDDLVEIKLPGITRIGGTFTNRNRTLLVAALSRVPAPVVYFGSRNLLPIFDKHKDSNWWWARKQARSLSRKVKTPCVGLPKWLIIRRVLASGIKREEVFSTEGLVIA